MLSRSRNVLVALWFLAVGVVIGSAASVARGDVLRVGGDVVRVELRYGDGRVQVFEAQPTATPTGTATATATSTPPPTNTPRPTVTPLPVTAVGTLYGTEAPLPPSLTPTLTSTPPITPTPDTLPATGTPPTAPPPSCEVQLQDFNIRLRAAPTTGAAIIGSVQARTTHEVYEATESAGYLWVRDLRGWFAIRQSDWWVWRVFGTECRDIPGWPDGLPPPPLLTHADTALGVWTGPGASASDVLNMIADLNAAGIQPAVTVYGANDLGRRAHDAGAFVLARPWLGDHPPYTLPPEVSARSWVDEAALNLGSGWYDCVVLTNEPIYPSWEYARDWIDAAIDRASERGLSCVVPVVFAPGHPELWAVDILRPAYQNAPIDVYFGLNLYPVEPHMLLSDRNAWTQYTTYRWQLYDPPAPIVVTEFARGDGSQPPDFADIGRFVASIDGELAIATAWYTSMPAGLGHWQNAVIRDLNALASALR